MFELGFVSVNNLNIGNRIRKEDYSYWKLLIGNTYLLWERKNKILKKKKKINKNSSFLTYVSPKNFKYIFYKHIHISSFANIETLNKSGYIPKLRSRGMYR